MILTLLLGITFLDTENHAIYQTYDDVVVKLLIFLYLSGGC